MGWLFQNAKHRNKGRVLATAFRRRRFPGLARNKSAGKPCAQFILFVWDTQAIDVPLCDCVAVFPCDYVIVLLCYHVDNGICVDLGLARRNAPFILAT